MNDIKGIRNLVGALLCMTQWVRCIQHVLSAQGHIYHANPGAFISENEQTIHVDHVTVKRALFGRELYLRYRSVFMRE